MPKPTDQPLGKKIKIDWEHLEKHIHDKEKKLRCDEKYARVRHLIRSNSIRIQEFSGKNFVLDMPDPTIDDATGEVSMFVDTPRRIANGRPPMQIINPDLESALNDIATLAGVN